MKKVQKSEYFAYVKQTAKVVNPLIASYFLPYKKTNKELALLFNPLLKKRTHTAPLRPVITRLSYELCGGKNWRTIANICALMEVHTMYLYFHNWIFDNKKGVWSSNLPKTRENVNGIIIAASLTREALAQAIDRLSVAPKMKQRLQQEFTQSLKEEYYGFFLDINLTCKYVKHFQSDEAYLKQYTEKSRLLSGSMYGLSAKIGAILAGATQEELKHITKLAEMFGTGLHISNDLGDFARPKRTKTTFGKPYQDQLADIREDRLTLPVFYTLKHGSERDRKNLLALVGKYAPSASQTKAALKAINHSGSYDYCHKFIKGFYNRVKHSLHAHFPKSKKRDLFAIMLSVIRTNKFLAELRTQIELVKK